MAIYSLMQNKKILIFGGSGSLGKTLISRLYKHNDVLIYSRDEAKHWTIKNTFNSINLSFSVGDIRDFSRIKEILFQFQPNIIIMASALKQVDTCELSPNESIQTNVIGIDNIVRAVEENINNLPELESVLMVSTDKACAPVNVYGMCKAISERTVTARSRFDHLGGVNFLCVRYGNVLDSRGSILPLFRHQVKTQDFITVTHPDMTRFLMTLDESVDLILTTLKTAKSGETWIPVLKSMRILDLAKIYADMYGKDIQISGIRPGEKLHEALVSECESTRAKMINDHHVLEPSYSSQINDNIFSYTSEDSTMSEVELKDYLVELDLLDRDPEDFIGKTIEEQKRH